MKVLIVTQYYWPETFPITGLVDLLTEQGVQVTVLTGKPNYPDGDVFPGYRAWGATRERRGDADIIRLPLFPRGRKSAWRLAANYMSFVLSGLLVGARLLRHQEYDIVFVYAPSPILQAIPAMLYARMRRVPLVVWVQDLWPQSLSATGIVKNSMALASVAGIVRWIYRGADRILVQSRSFVRPVAELTDRPEKIHYFPNLGPTQRRSDAGIDAKRLVVTLRTRFSVVFAGNLGTAQGLNTIVEAARLLRDRGDIGIVLVGSGSRDGWLKQQCIDHSLANLHLAGRFDPSDMPAIFDAAGALLVTLRPDPAFEMTIPSKVQAYLAAGRPIMAGLDGEGAQVVLDSGAGLCVPSGNAAELASAITRLADMPPDAREEMGRRGRAYFEQHFAPDHLVRELITHFNRTISDTGKTA